MISYDPTTNSNPGGARPRVSVLGIGGAGSNVLDGLALEGVGDATLACLNTDQRALNQSLAPQKVQLGKALTRGLGAGGDPEVGREAAAATVAEIDDVVQDRDIVFICVGLGGGTGSGATPLVVERARAAGAFVVVFAVMPFPFEGRRRKAQAEGALKLLSRQANALMTFENARMGELVSQDQGIEAAFAAADEVVGQGIRAVTGLVSRPGMIRIGMDDLITALRQDDSRCLFGYGEGLGENRAQDALAMALDSPLLDRGALLADARNVLVHIAGGKSMTLFEVEDLMRELGSQVSDDTQVLFGTAADSSLGEKVVVTLISSFAGPADKSKPNRAAAGATFVAGANGGPFTARASVEIEVLEPAGQPLRVEAEPSSNGHHPRHPEPEPEHEHEHEHEHEMDAEVEVEVEDQTAEPAADLAAEPEVHHPAPTPAEFETQAEAAPEAEVEVDSAPEAEAGVVAEAETEATADTAVAQADPEPEPEPVAEAVDVAEAEPVEQAVEPAAEVETDGHDDGTDVATDTVDAFLRLERELFAEEFEPPAPEPAADVPVAIEEAVVDEVAEEVVEVVEVAEVAEPVAVAVEESEEVEEVEAVEAAEIEEEEVEIEVVAEIEEDEPVHQAEDFEPDAGAEEDHRGGWDDAGTPQADEFDASSEPDDEPEYVAGAGVGAEPGPALDEQDEPALAMAAEEFTDDDYRPEPDPRPGTRGAGASAAAKQAAEAEAKAKANAESRARQEGQGMLDFEPASRGRFDRSTPTVIDGEDLDQPTFLRKRRGS